MGEKRTQIRAKTGSDGTTEVVVLVSHPMETGLRTHPQTKDKIPPNFIQKMTFLLNGKEMIVADLGPGIAKDPLISARIKATRGDRIKVIWSDNLGEKDEVEITVTEGA